MPCVRRAVSAQPGEAVGRGPESQAGHGAIFWSGIRRVVFGIDAVALRVFRGELATQRDAELSCRAVFAASPHAIGCIGPVLGDEAAGVHQGFWR
ncbi:hypothetical protein DFR39_10588 [Roseateles asaccharophilus]|uniref:Uncharacterized protein n=1 Tax=Roseateles asaccharophilus TaxID=582607 RepID=A0A4R6N502_9BURK|nr:hypothetical protein DFR39_10588 [Roseateles asaccharophilus]